MRNLSTIFKHLRNLDTIHNSRSYKFTKRFQHAPAAKHSITAEDKTNFMNLFPTIVEDLKSYAASFNPHPAPDWFERNIKYNVSHGKNNRGLLTVLAFKELATEDQKTPENYKRALVLGWCTELLTGAMLALDDMVDGSETRRKKPCWYKLEDVGYQAINDCLMLENGLYHLVDKYFSETEYYMKVMELFREATFATGVGQVLDLQASRENVTTFTMDKYKKLCRAKSSYGTFSVPVFMAMHICGITNEKAFAETDKILFEICYFFQTHNDFEDCYGDPKVTGRVGTDIEDNRCTWMAVEAVSRADKRQLKILEECYGQKDPEKANHVRRIYDELDMRNLFAEYEKERYNYIKDLITSRSVSVKPDLFLKIWELFYFHLQK